jgi:hypothetical protein
MAGTRINTPPPTQYNVRNLTTTSKGVERRVGPIPYKKGNSEQDGHINFQNEAHLIFLAELNLLMQKLDFCNNVNSVLLLLFCV